MKPIEAARFRPGLQDLLWMAAGAATLLLIVLAVLHFNPLRDASGRAAAQGRRIELVDEMSSALASASASEKSAVLATTEQMSQSFAEQARAQSRAVDEWRAELEQILLRDGSRTEKDLLASFTRSFLDFQRADDQILELAGKNTNLKAYALAYGPAQDELLKMEGALSSLVSASSGSPDVARITAQALGAANAALRVQTLLPPHIAEATDEKMSALEAQMEGLQRDVEKDLENLAAIPSLAGSSDLESAKTSWGRYLELKAKILRLSRENTNVASLGLSLTIKQQATAACQEALGKLRSAIKENDFAPVSPR